MMLRVKEMLEEERFIEQVSGFYRFILQVAPHRRNLRPDLVFRRYFVVCFITFASLDVRQGLVMRLLEVTWGWIHYRVVEIRQS